MFLYLGKCLMKTSQKIFEISQFFLTNFCIFLQANKMIKAKFLAEISFFKKNAKFSQYNFPFSLETIVEKTIGPIFNLDTL